MPPAPEKGRKARDILFWLYVAALAWAPFWFGSNDPLSWSINAILFPGLVVLLELNLIVSGRPHAVPLGRIWLSAVLFGLVCTWIVVQAVTITPAQWHHPLWVVAESLIGGRVEGSISLDRNETMSSLVRLLTVACCLWSAMQLCRNSQRAEALVRSVAAIGCAYAIYGLVVFYLSPNTILWYQKLFYTESVTSTFINRNTYAAYAGLSFVCLLGLSFDFSGARSGGDGWRLSAANAISRVVGPAGLAMLGGLIVAAALVRTGSRGGVAATILAVLVFLVLYVGFRRTGSRTGTALIGLAAVAILGFVALTYGDLLASRLSTNELDTGERSATYALTLKAVSDRPLEGFGYGTFQEAFPQYRDNTVLPWFTWDKAHNTFLELALEIGIPATVLLILSIGLLVGRCLRAVGDPNSSSAPLIAVSATAVIVGTSLIDFGVQIQAVALTWVALLGAGYAQAEDARAKNAVAVRQASAPEARFRSSRS